MYSIMMKDGKIINVKANGLQELMESKTLILFNDGNLVARINTDNIVGWIDLDYMAERDDKNERN